MPLRNFIGVVLPPTMRVANEAELREGDVVCWLAVDDGSGRLRSRSFAHVGLVGEAATDHGFTRPIRVLHMGNSIENDDWNWVRHNKESCVVDVAGIMRGIDESVRAGIIDAAWSLYQRPPSLLARERPLCYYWMGHPRLQGHPLFPEETNAHALSCATFVHECYRIALPSFIGSLIRVDRMPVTTTDELEQLRRVFGEHVEARAFPRLYPGYLLGAFELDQYPFDPPEWNQWKDHSRYITKKLFQNLNGSGSFRPPRNARRHTHGGTCVG